MPKLKKAGKHPGGRPTIYGEEILIKTRAYLTDTKDQYVDIPAGKDKDGNTVFINKFQVNLPSLQGLARYLGINQDTIYDWRSKYPEFSDILAQILAEQSKRLIEKGLSGDYNSNIAKLVLGKHGYHEKSDVEVTVPKPISDVLQDSGVQESSKAQ